jgi:type I restriction enzyme S subunit
LQSVFNESSDGWVEQKLGDVCSLITDGKHGDCNNKNDSGYYFLSAKDVKNNTLQYEKARQITKNDFEETHRRTDLKPGDVLITNSGTIGRMAIAPNDSKTYKTTFQKSVAVLKPKPAIINNVFCCYHLRADLSKLVNVSAGTAQKNLLIGDLKNHLIKIPPISKQLELIEKLDNLSLDTSKLESLYERKMVDLEELKKSILQKAFSGDLIRRAS